MKKYPEMNHLSDRLTKFMRSLMIRTDICNERKIELWLNVPNHLTGNHMFCDHGNLIDHNNLIFTESEYATLNEILKATVKYTTKSYINNNTQSNESFYAIKALMAPKQKAWKCSYQTRIELGILRWNEGDNYIIDLCEKLGIPFENWQKKKSRRMLKNKKIENIIKELVNIEN